MKQLHQFVFALLVGASALEAQTPPSSPGTPPLFTRNDAIWAAAFLGATLGLTAADVRITRWATGPSVQTPRRDTIARNLARFQEGTLTIGNLALYGIARLAKWPTMADITFHAAESVVVGSVVSQVIRGPLGRSRPYVTDYDDPYDFHPFQGFTNFKYRAFPSIHTASSFAVATVYTLETRRRAGDAAWIVGPITYLLASGPAIARLYSGQHWASDLLSGAFVGVLAGAKVVRYNHHVNPHNRVNRFFLGDENVQLGFSAGSVSATWSRRF